MQVAVDFDKVETITSINPATGEVLGRVPSFTDGEARRAVEAAAGAQEAWEAAGLDERIRVVRKFTDELLDDADAVSRLISAENGKVLQESFQMEVFPVIDLARYFSARAGRILKPRRIRLHLLRHRRSVIHYRPRGVVLVISPWNYPFSIPFGEVIMALLAGNAVVLKPASNTPLIALKGRELFDRAGLEPDLFRVVTGPGRLGSDMVGMGVDYVSFTGSVEVGTRLAELCGRHLIPCTMELGGKDPALVLPGADLEHAAGSIVWGAFANAGQTCSGVERVYVHRTMADALTDMIVKRTKTLRIGNPLDDGVDMGPLTDARQLEKVADHVDSALAGGARALTGGKRLDGPGLFFPPTVLVDVDDSMKVMTEETFGPVLPIVRVDSVDEAVARANASMYGLNAYVFAPDMETARKTADRLEAGTVMINETLITHAAPETPWGGVKKSGIGRVHSDDGLRHLSVAYHVNEPAFAPHLRSPFWQPYSHGTYAGLVDLARVLDHSKLSSRLRSAWKLIREHGPVKQLRRARAPRP
jgi:succinate-semialdehyde dehydrogenase/glutarate-semialdehyde dehydrogenase